MSEDSAAQATQDATQAGQPADTEPQQSGEPKQPEATYTQADIDRAVSQALKTREQKLQEKQAEAQKQAELKAAEERGEFEKVKASYEQQIAQMRLQALARDVNDQLRDAATAAGLVDLDDLKLVQDRAIAEAVGDSGDIDAAAIKRIVDEFKEAKPHKFKAPEPADQQRFRGRPTPPSGEVDPSSNVVNPLDYDAIYKQRKAQYKRLTSPQQRRANTISELADAIARRMNQ